MFDKWKKSDKESLDPEKEPLEWLETVQPSDRVIDNYGWIFILIMRELLKRIKKCEARQGQVHEHEYTQTPPFDDMCNVCGKPMHDPIHNFLGRKG